MVNHDLARLTMIMASVPWLGTLGSFLLTPERTFLGILGSRFGMSISSSASYRIHLV